MADVFRGLALLETLKESLESNKLSEIKDAMEDLLISRINLAIVGERGEEKRSLINVLRGLGPQEENAACSPSAPEELAVYPSTRHPDFQLWDLPPVLTSSPGKVGEYMDRVKFLRYNAVFLTFSHTPSASSVALFLEAHSVACGAVYFTLLASEKDTEKSLEAKRKASLEVLRAEGVSRPKLYLLCPLTMERFDFPELLEDLGWDLPEIRANALILALPTLTSSLVSQKREVLKLLVWAAASLSGGVSALPVPFVASMVDSSVAVRILTKAQVSLCLDDESVARLARQRHKNPTELKAMRNCLLSVEVTRGEVRKRLTAAEKNLTKVSSRLVDMAMPMQARSACGSFSTMQQALSEALDEMSADAEKIVAAALTEGK